MGITWGDRDKRNDIQKERVKESNLISMIFTPYFLIKHI